MMANASNNGDGAAGTITPLREWIEGIEPPYTPARPWKDDTKHGQQRRESLLGKTTVAFGLAEMLRRARSHGGAPFASSRPSRARRRWRVDHFAVRSAAGRAAAGKGVRGVDMLSPARLPMDLVEPFFLRDDAAREEQMGRYLEVHFPTLPEDPEGAAAAAVSQSEEDERCHALGLILYELFSGLPPEPSEDGSDSSEQPACKKSRLSESEVIQTGKSPIGAWGDMSSTQVPARQEDDAKESSISPDAGRVPLTELGFPSSVSLLVQHLLQCGMHDRPDDAYDSLDAVSKDLHLLLLDPARFLFDREIPQDKGRVPLLFRKHTLYGREVEVQMITDAFCRVSEGRCEAFFIEGFSGSGKSQLVNSLKARVDISEGYVLTHKFDQMSKERGLLELVAVFDGLCSLIREKRTQKDLDSLANHIKEVFGTDFSMLAQLLPNIHTLSQLQSTTAEGDSDVRLNLHSVSFILQRFLRVVSSREHPIMLFVDDIQWSDNSALTLIEEILCDSIRSSCIFVVAAYRSNEVEHDHDLFRMIDSLNSHGLPTTRLSLEGLAPEHLNGMISDAMGIFPRISEPLSDIVFQKTKGNPFFALEFMRSLVDGGMLEYDTCQRRWIWDEVCISSTDITGNVIYLLSSKMSSLSENVQLALKVASCFGIKMKEAIVNYLGLDSEYAGMPDGMEHVLKEGFMIKVGASEYKFVHDKIREAAYSLIQNSNKKKYRYRLGIVLYSMTKGSDSDINPIVFSITDQINCIDSSEVPPELRLEFAELNKKSGTKAMDHSDYTTAASYLSTALSLLPADHWQQHYDLSLQSHVLLTKSYYSSGDSHEAHKVVQQILLRGSCLSDKLEAYHIVASILYDRGELQGAYVTNSDVLLKLGETIPDELGTEEAKETIESTSKMLKGLSEDSLLGMKKMENKEMLHILKFYRNVALVAFYANASVLPFVNLRIIQLSMAHGLSKYFLLGLLQHAAVICLTIGDIHEETCRIAKIAMTLFERFESATDQYARACQIYYGVVAIYSEPVQSSVNSLRRGFDCGLATGDTSSGLISAGLHLSKCLIAGTNLALLLKRTNYYLEVTKTIDNSMARKTFLLFLDTIHILMGKEYDGCSEEVDTHQGAVYHKTVRAFWTGQYERSHHFAQKIVHEILPGYRNHRIQVMHYFGLNPFKFVKRPGGQKAKQIYRQAMETLEAAACYSEWNFRNKVHLLQAEMLSCEKKNTKAALSYTSAIVSAQRSRFKHEEGLACERAAFHYKKIGDLRSAYDLFNQAKQCYEDWGSQMKVDSILNQLKSVQT